MCLKDADEMVVWTLISMYIQEQSHLGLLLRSDLSVTIYRILSVNYISDKNEGFFGFVLLLFLNYIGSNF